MMMALNKLGVKSTGVILLSLALFGELFLRSQPSVQAMGWLEKKISGQDFWEKVDKAKPVVKQRADQTLHSLGYDVGKLSFAIFLSGEGEEAWTVKYWRHPPRSDDETAIMVKHAEVEVYLDNHGRVRRVVKYERDQEQLLYGKDERIDNGMTHEQVRERLGQPDRRGPPPRWARDLGDDELWLYKESLARTMEIRILFRAGKVSSVSYFGK